MTVSHHMLRRTARAKARRLNGQHIHERVALGDTLEVRYHVEQAKRGPWRWRVVRQRLD